MTIRQSLLRNKGIAAVVLEGIAQSGSFGGTLCCVEVTCSLYDFPQLLVCVCETDVRLLNLQCCKLGTKIRFSDPEI
jgi:hypothetical protein